MQDVKKQVIITSIWLKQVSVYALSKRYAQTPQDLPQIHLCQLANLRATTLWARKTKARGLSNGDTKRPEIYKKEGPEILLEKVFRKSVVSDLCLLNCTQL